MHFGIFTEQRDKIRQSKWALDKKSVAKDVTQLVDHSPQIKTIDHHHNST